MIPRFAAIRVVIPALVIITPSLVCKRLRPGQRGRPGAGGHWSGRTGREAGSGTVDKTWGKVAALLGLWMSYPRGPLLGEPSGL